MPLRIPNFIKNLGARIWETQFEHTPPAIRYLDIAFVTLERKTSATVTPDDINSAYECVGSFVPELYELANTPEGSLKCQWQEREWRKAHPDVADADYKDALNESDPSLYNKLYRPDGNRKTPFELALIPSERLTDIQTAVKREYKHRRDLGLALPAPISKLRVLPDYLPHLEDINLRAKEYPNAVKVNLRNPHEKATTREKVFHFLELPAAILITLSAAIALSGFASTWAIAAGIVGLYIAKIKANEFSMFDLAEALYRDIGWLTAKDIPWKGKFSLSNTLKTLGQLATIGVAVYFAGVITWTGTFDLPWQMLGVNNTVQGLKIASALFFSTVAAVSTIVGLTASQRYFWNISFNNNQVEDLTIDLANSLPVVAPKARAYRTSSEKEEELAAENAALRAALLEARSAPIIPQATAAASAPTPALLAGVPDDDDPAHRSAPTLH